jgi:hypothetical protein
MEDASGLLVAARVVADSLQAGQLEHRRPSHGREVVEEIHRHADRVASEQAVEQAACPG